MRLSCIDVTVASASDIAEASTTGDLVVLTKIDLAPQQDWADLVRPQPLNFATSSVTGAGLDELAGAIAALLSTDAASSRAGCVAATAERCRDSVRLADAAIDHAAEIAIAGGGDELVAAEIRVALAELGKIVGAVYTDDLLDRIFSTFCIGK